MFCPHFFEIASILVLAAKGQFLPLKESKVNGLNVKKGQRHSRAKKNAIIKYAFLIGT